MVDRPAVDLWIGGRRERAGGRLLSVRFGEPCGAAGADDAGTPFAAVANRVLGGSPGREVWHAAGPVRTGRGPGEAGPVCWAEDGKVLFGTLATPLAEGPARETRAHFAALLETIEALGFPYLLRVWNVLPGINDEQAGSERYRLFNAGRAEAFDARYGAAGAEARFSASSAVGTSGDRLVSWFAAARSPGRHLGNPRQVHAFRYPPAYGPRAPSFSRATVAPAELGGALFLSGTASIAGSASRHEGCVRSQLEETLENVDVLLESGGGPALEEFDLVRVYLRRAEDLEAVEAPLRRRLGSRPILAIVEADICRAELLIEIEGVALAGTAERAGPDFAASLADRPVSGA